LSFAKFETKFYLRTGLRSQSTTRTALASVVKILNATNSIGRFYKINYFPQYKNALAFYSAGVVVVDSKVV
jgi:hypothetical protein